MSTPVPALPMPAPAWMPGPAWLPGLAELDPGELIIVIGDQRPQGPPLESCRHVRLAPARIGQARLAGRGLHIDVAPGDEDWALALVAAFARPDRPAAADPASRALLDLARRVGATATSVLIEGPTGTGKEGLARLVHAASARRTRPLVAVNCAALADQMVEATLFGHDRGAFTGAVQAAPGLVRSADGGSLFLDEVGELCARR